MNTAQHPYNLTLIVKALTLLAASPALAQSESQLDALLACRQHSNPTERLACFDLASQTERSASQAATSPPPRQVHSLPPTQADQKPEQSSFKTSGLLDQAWELSEENRGQILRIRPYKPVYILPIFYTSSTNTSPHSPSPAHSVTTPQTLSHNEAKLQISLKTKMAEDVFGNNGDLWFGYTQSSRWQVYNAATSRPFRETNHEPEAMLVWRTNYDVLGWQGKMLSLGINHQSNGRSLPYSRSWNRVIGAAHFERDNWTLAIRPWWRIPEKSNEDDNPDISDYLGRGDIMLIKRWGQQEFSALVRHAMTTGQPERGAIQLDWAFPLAGQLRGHLQIFSGYGESMIDYNHHATYYGLGVSLLEWY